MRWALINFSANLTLYFVKSFASHHHPTQKVGCIKAGEPMYIAPKERIALHIPYFAYRHAFSTINNYCTLHFVFNHVQPVTQCKYSTVIPVTMVDPNNFIVPPVNVTSAEMKETTHTLATTNQH